jgi:DNA-binding NarL/FixJ family response regulator
VNASIAIVDDHELLSQSLELALGAQGFAARVHAVEDLEATLTSVLESQPDVVLLDLQLGPVGHGLALVGPLTRAGTRVLVITGVTDRCEIAATIEAGAIGYVSKSKPIDVLLETINRVARGEQVMSDAERHDLLTTLRRWRAEDEAVHAPLERLTDRERQVLQALADGHGVAEIAHSGFVSVATVRTQVHAILSKLEVGSQLEAVAMAHRYGWFQGPGAVWSRPPSE